MSVRNKLVGIFGWILATSFSGGASADDLQAQREALTVIREFAREMCGAPNPLDGRSTHLELSGDMKAQLTGVIAKVAELGIAGAGKYKDDNFKNVLHEQLAQSLSDGANCRFKIFEVLHKDMLVQRQGR